MHARTFALRAARLLGAAGLSIAAVSAGAQTVWTGPAGRFSLTVPASWQVQPAPAADGRGLATDLLATPAGEDPASPKTACGVFRWEQPMKSDVDQATVNRVTAASTKEKLVAEAARPKVAVTEVRKYTNEPVQGVQVATMHHVLDFAGTPQAVWQAQFLLAPGGRRITVFSVTCFAPLSAPQEVQADAGAMFESLRFAVVDAV